MILLPLWRSLPCASESRALAGPIRPDRDTLPPAFCAAASAWVKGRDKGDRVVRRRHGRTRNSRSLDMAASRTLPKAQQIQIFVCCQHIAPMRSNVRKASKKQANTTGRQKHNVLPFILPSLFGRIPWPSLDSTHLRSGTRQCPAAPLLHRNYEGKQMASKRSADSHRERCFSCSRSAAALMM